MAQAQPEQVIDIPGVGSVAFPASMSEAEVNAAATRLYKDANPGKKQPPVTSWFDTATEWLPTVGATAGGIVGGMGGTAFGMGFGGIPGAAGGAALGGSAGEAAKQLINRARGADAPVTSMDAATAIGAEGAQDAIGAALLGGAGKVVGAVAPKVGRGMVVAGETMDTLGAARGARQMSVGGAILESVLLGQASIGSLAIPPLMQIGGKGLAKAGEQLVKVGAGKAAKGELSARLSRIPLQDRLSKIGTEAVDDVPKFAADTAETLADDVALIRDSIAMKYKPETALKIVANGDKAYYDVLKTALLESIKREGVPPPKAVADLMKTPSFARLAKP